MNTEPSAPTPPSASAAPITEVGFAELIRRELDGLGKSAGAVNPDKSLESDLLDRNLFGLALSGGGIRSATFGLGVIQHLAQLGLIRHLDFLSTVSGGGYLGSWLAAWIQRETAGVNEVEKQLIPRPQEHADSEEAAPIHWLRCYGKYLAPKSGLFSPDTWTIIAISLRNTILNLSVLIMFLLAVMTIPWVIATSYVSGLGSNSLASALQIIFATLGGICAVAGSRYSWAGGTYSLGLLSVVFLSVASVFQLYISGDTQPNFLVLWGGLFSVIYIISTVDWDTRRRWQILTRAMIGIACGAVGMVLAPQILEPIERQFGFLAPIILPPLTSYLYCILITFLLGIMGRYVTEERREWWSRIGSLILIFSTAWLLFSTLVLIGPSVFDFLLIRSAFLFVFAMVSVWVIATTVGVLEGRSSSTNGNTTRWSPLKDAILPVLPPIFVVGLLILFANILSHVIFDRQPIPPMVPIICEECRPQTFSAPTIVESWYHVWYPFARDVMKGPRNFWPPAFLMGMFALAYFVFSWLIDINEFSMHRFYRNRLVRGFQGASRGTHRQADPFTNLDANDDIPVTTLQRENGYTGPVHLVNTAINLNLAQTGLDERRAGSFVFSPYGCGYSVGGEHIGHCQFYPQDCDLSLGTPVTASGAAASPNMGYHTSTPVAFLLTVFNVRLGYWIRNPNQTDGFSLSRWLVQKGWAPKTLAAMAAWEPSGPRNGQIYFIYELFARANDRRKYVYLSDGGHFENLAVYELLRRRCRYIICVDGEQDENMVFGGLGGLMRRARSDMGIEIRIETADIEQRSAEGWSRAHCAVGRIIYPEDTLDGQKQEGYLLYLKLSVTGDEPVDIINYRKVNPAFPHQSTGNQFFDESQFESYRRLGFHVTHQTFRSVPTELFYTTKSLNLQRIYQELYNTWYGMPHSVTEHFTKHAEALNNLLNDLQTNNKLQTLHTGLNPDWPTAMVAIEPIPIDPEEYRTCFYFCQRLIQLMENVYMDLDLESNFEHPSCSGWMEQFRDWTRAPMLKETYDKTKHTFSVKFVSFFARHFV